MSKYQDVRVGSDAYVNEHPEVIDIARAITLGLAEEHSKVSMDGMNTFRVDFMSSYTHIKLVNVRWTEAKGYAFKFYMMKGSEIVYQYSTAGMSQDDICDFFERHRKEGFKSGDYGTFMWDGAASKSTKPKQFDGVDWLGQPLGDAEAISRIADCIRRVTGEDSLSVMSESANDCRIMFRNRHSCFQMRDTDTGGSNRQMFFLQLSFDGRALSNFTLYPDELDDFERKLRRSVENGFDVIGGGTYYWKTDSFVDDDAETTDKPTSYDGPTAQSHNGVVPDGITSIRTVALKHEGKVIAFRFKTDKGSFDMSKETAIQYGLGGFKSEKYIALKSVNGILMSESEMKKNVFIPDVSDNESDCRKLISAIFSLR